MYPTAAAFLPSRLTLPALRRAARNCRGCDLYQHATQAVFGEGSDAAGVLLVGEQPGDKEDRAGKPFVGPAGALLDKALADAGVDWSQVYVTNAVKHFKFEPQLRGKRRIHSKPSARQVQACRPWLSAEIEVIRPRAIVCLGATAAQALLGSAFRLTRHRSQWQTSERGVPTLATVHPSSLLRMPDPAAREAAYAAFVADLRLLLPYLQRG